MGECGVKKAVALRPITSANAILPYIEELDMVLVMTVEPDVYKRQVRTRLRIFRIRPCSFHKKYHGHASQEAWP